MDHVFHPPARSDALDRLTFLGWRRSLVAVIAGLAVSFLLFGYFVVYWRNADMDFMVVYSALAMNAGKSQQYLDHTAYLTILAMKSWFRLLHQFGLLDAWTLPAIPKATDAAGFDAAMTHAIRAGRVLAFAIAIGCIAIFAALSRRIVGDRRVALLATFAFALSGGIAVHLRIIRSELVAACPIVFALMLLITIGRRAHVARPLGLGLASALCVLGLENKVQAILLIGVLPLLILPFGGARSASVAFWRTGEAWLAVLISGIVAAAACWMAWPLIAAGFDRSLLVASQFHPLLFNRFGIYQIALLILIGTCMVAYAAIWKISVSETLASISAVIAGAALTLLLLYVDYNPANALAVANPLEKMLTFADPNTANAADSSNPVAAILLLLQGLGSVLARYTFVLHSSPRPTVFLIWLIVPGIIFAWRRGERQASLQAAVLMLAALAIDTLGVRRGLKAEYFIFSDPLIIIAGAVLLDRLRDLGFHKRAYPIAATLFGLHIAFSQAEPVKYAFKRTGPESTCEWNAYYMPLMPLPWCPARS